MATNDQKVIAARDVDIYITFDAIGVAYRLQTGVSFNANITGNTEDIGAISTDEPIGTDNGGNTYDITISFQKAEAITLMASLATATADSETGSIVHIRQLVEAATLTAVWHKRRNNPPESSVESYTNCTGVEESDGVERRGIETLITWRFRGRGKTIAPSIG